MSRAFYATIARYYDSEHHDKDEDLPLYLELAAAAGRERPALILGSGTGRLALELAAARLAVHGVEIEPAMLERAQRKLAARPDLAERVTFHAGDALTLELPAGCGLVLIPYNTLMHFLTLDDQQALLRRARAALAPGGLLVIDLPNAGEAFAAQDTEALILERTFLDQETGRQVMQQSVSRLDRAAQKMFVTWIYDAIGADGMVERTVAPVVIHYYFYSELRLLLELCGLRITAVYGDFDRTPFEDGSPRLIVIAAAAD